MSWDDFDVPMANAVTIGGAPTLGYSANNDDNAINGAATGGSFEDIVASAAELDANGRRKKAPVPTKSLFDGAYAALSDDKVPIPLRVLMATQHQYQVVTVETDTGYTYCGVLESVDANMNVKLKDCEIKKEVWAAVKDAAAVSSHHLTPRNVASSSSSFGGAAASSFHLERKVIYHKPAPAFTSSTMIRGSSIVFVQLPPSLEPEQRYLAGVIKKDIADKRRRDKKERLERIVEMGKKRERESALTAATANAGSGGGDQQNNANGSGGDAAKDKRRLAKAQDAARAAGQKLRKILKSEARHDRQKSRRKEGKGQQ